MYQYKDESGLPMGKLVLGVLLLFMLLGGGVFWYGSVEAEKKADELLATAQDQYRLERLDAALSSIDQALRLKEKREYLDFKVQVLTNQNKVFEADKVLTTLIEHHPKNAHYRYQLATMALNEESLIKAESNLRMALQLEPKNGEYRVGLANILHRSEKFAEAQALYEEAIQKDPDYKYAWQQYATVYSNAGDYAKAIAIEKRALSRFPNDSDFYFLLASTLDTKGDKQGAVSAYRRSLELEPMANSIAARRIFEMTGQHVPPALEKMEASQIPLDVSHNLMFVNAELNGKRGRFLLDTGASLCVLFKSKMSKYALTGTGTTIEAGTANGTVQADVAYGNLRLGLVNAHSVQFGVIADQNIAEADGIIGMNFLGNFQMDVDKNSRKMTLTHSG